MSETWIQCAMSGRLYRDDTHGIWDDGEWISWDYINDHREQLELQADYPRASVEVAEHFKRLVENAHAYQATTGRFLEIWGELGELYVETKFGLKRHPAYREGSDGTIDGVEIEVKTMSPLRRSECVRVKDSGCFESLIVVKISEDYRFEARRFPRSSLEGSGGLLRAQWEQGEDMGCEFLNETSRAQRMFDAYNREHEEE